MVLVTTDPGMEIVEGGIRDIEVTVVIIVGAVTDIVDGGS
jgi:hypothetical protein